jgi:aspartate aminotransferase
MSAQLSKYAQAVGGSTVVGMRRKADALEASGIKVIDFGIGEPDFEAPPPVREAAIRAIRDGHGNYVDPRGLASLREAIAQFEHDRHGHSPSPDQIVVTAGSYGALSVITRALLDDDAEVLVLEPGWGPYKALVALTGARAIGVPMGTRDDRFVIDAGLLEDAVTQRTRAIIFNSPWNPTGRVLSTAELGVIAEVAQRHDLWLIADEVYSELIYGDAVHESIAALSPEVAARTLIATSFSKSFAMTGWRLGYCVASAQMAPILARINQYTLRCPTSFVQHAGIAAINDGGPFVAAMLAEYTQRRDVIAAGLNAIDGVVCPHPEGTFYAFPAIAREWGDSADVAERLLEHSGVLLTPGSAYGAASRYHLRLSFATSVDIIEEGMTRLRAAAANF